jgi:excisionase family DNA binding protein
MSYIRTREEAAQFLEISTRTLDRYVKSWKIRSKRIGKIVYVHEEDVLGFKHGDPELIRPTDSVHKKSSAFVQDPELIIYDSSESNRNKDTSVSYKELYQDVLIKVQEKDKVIQELSYRAGQAEAELKNSVSMIEHKKQTFLLESARTRTDEDIRAAEQKVTELQQELVKSQFSLYILVALVTALLLASSVFLYFLI